MEATEANLLGSNHSAAVNSGLALNAKQSFFSELAFNLNFNKNEEDLNQSLERLVSWLQKIDDYICFELLLFKEDDKAIKRLNLENKDPYEMFVYICLNKIPEEGELSGETLLELRGKEREILKLAQNVRSQKASYKKRRKLIEFLSNACNAIEKRFFEVNPDYGKID